MANILLYFDGACEPNPGGVGSYGFTITGIDGLAAPLGKGGVVPPIAGQAMTNNVAEYTALGMALRALADNPAAVRPGDTLTIRGDSQLVVNQLNGRWACNAAHLGRLRGRCLELLDLIACEWAAEWVPREQNAEADALSVRAWEAETGKPFPVRVKRPKPPRRR